MYETRIGRLIPIYFFLLSMDGQTVILFSERDISAVCVGLQQKYIGVSLRMEIYSYCMIVGLRRVARN